MDGFRFDLVGDRVGEVVVNHPLPLVPTDCGYLRRFLPVRTGGALSWAFHACPGTPSLAARGQGTEVAHGIKACQRIRSPHSDRPKQPQSTVLAMRGANRPERQVND